MQNYFMYKKHYAKDQEIIKFFDNLYRKRLQDNLTDKNEYESPCKIFTKFLDETKKTNLFYSYMNLKTKVKLFGNNKIKFNLKP